MKMNQLSTAARLYCNFRRFVKKQELDGYDKEFLSKEKHTYKFMIPFINKYVNIKKLSTIVTNKRDVELIAYFLNEYSVKESRLLKALNNYKVNYK